MKFSRSNIIYQTQCQSHEETLARATWRAIATAARRNVGLQPRVETEWPGLIILRLTLYGPRSSTMQVKMASRPTETVRLLNGLPNLGKSVTRERPQLKYHAIARAFYV